VWRAYPPPVVSVVSAVVVVVSAVVVVVAWVVVVDSCSTDSVVSGVLSSSSDATSAPIRASTATAIATPAMIHGHRVAVGGGSEGGGCVDRGGAGRGSGDASGGYQMPSLACHQPGPGCCVTILLGSLPARQHAGTPRRRLTRRENRTRPAERGPSVRADNGDRAVCLRDQASIRVDLDRIERLGPL
jgi:hypothetical protein